MLYQSWWKILAVVLLLYVFLAGMLVPLKPGLLRVQPGSLRTGEEARLEVHGYNTFFRKDQGRLRAWLKLDEERALGARGVDVQDDRLLSVTFDIPEYLPVDRRVQDFALIIDGPEHGASVLPSAVFVTQDSIDPEMGKAAWASVNVPIAELHAESRMNFPFRNILGETIRNTYFHVSLWLAMLLIFGGSLVFSIRYLRGFDPKEDLKALALTRVGVLFGILGLVTGAIWARHTWGAYWSWDVKQNMTAIAMLIYFAYFVLRNSFEDPEKKARLSAVYNIFAFTTLIPLLYVIPRMVDSLHPGSGGNPAFGSQDLDNTMRMVFYPAVIGWTLFGYWMASLVYRMERLHNKILSW